MKDTAVAIGAMNQADILRMESEKSFELKVQGQTVTLSPKTWKSCRRTSRLAGGQ